MRRKFEPDDALLRSYEVTAPVLIADTDRTAVWRVNRQGGGHAALKLYRDGAIRNEAPGFALLQMWDGEGAARLLGKNSFSALIEWLDGPSLGDFSRDGKDKGAAVLLARAARRLHACQTGTRAKLPVLEEWIEPLMTLQTGTECPKVNAADIGRAQNIAKRLVSTQPHIIPLHGDLHQDNVRCGARGFCAFDAKGILGEPAYELANAFRNPNGVHPLHRDEARILFLAGLWARELGLDKARLLNWAAAKCALSIAWRSGGELHADEELDLLSILLHVAEANPVSV